MATRTDESGAVAADREVRWDRRTWLTGAWLIAVSAAAWVTVVLQASMKAMPGAAPAMNVPAASQPPMPMLATVQPGMALPGHGLADALAFLAAWGVMMTAMMLPSATPMIAFYGTIRRNLSQTGQAGIPAPLFALVYLILWLATGIPVYAVSIAIGAAAQAYPKIAALMPYALALSVVAAGVYQFSPLKRACLRVCSTPLGFLIGRWRGGYRGTYAMAFEHAAYCIGCGWGLMLVLVAVGAMSLPWVLAIAAAVFVEKILPDSERTARVFGVVLVVLGLLIALQPGLAAAMRGPGM